MKGKTAFLHEFRLSRAPHVLEGLLPRLQASTFDSADEQCSDVGPGLILRHTMHAIRVAVSVRHFQIRQEVAKDRGDSHFATRVVRRLRTADRHHAVHEIDVPPFEEKRFVPTKATVSGEGDDQFPFGIEKRIEHGRDEFPRDVEKPLLVPMNGRLQITERIVVDEAALESEIEELLRPPRTACDRIPSELLRLHPPLPRKRRLLVALYHSYIDTSSGAAISLRDAVEALVKRDWDVRVFSGPKLDFEDGKTNSELLQEQGIPFATYEAKGEGGIARLHMFVKNGVECAIFDPCEVQKDVGKAVGSDWLRTYHELLNDWRPNAVITYGGSWIAPPLLKMAQEVGARTVFFLCNYAYSNASLFEHVDTTIVASRFHGEWYKQQIGIDSVPVYPLIDPETVVCERDPDTRYVTLVNPQPHKGVYVFAKIAEALSRERPDIPLLVVESRAASHWIGATGANLKEATNLFRMRNTPNPTDFYYATHIALMPSVWQESFGRIAAEAMMNGVPVIAGTRGSLPEVVGDAGVLIDIPERITPQSRELPTDAEIRPWTNAITRLWDDKAHYHAISERALARSEIWAADRIAQEFEKAIVGRS